MKKKKKKKKEPCNHRFDEGHVVHLAHPASEYLTQVSQQPDSCFQHLFALLLERRGGGGEGEEEGGGQSRWMGRELQ